MGMSIDEADTILSCERLDSSMCCGASDEDIDEALGVAIETMRKYQQIVNIVSLNDEEFKQCGLKELKEILEVIADGNEIHSNNKH